MSFTKKPHPNEVEQIEAVVKWFNLSKGFGFVSPADNTADAFLHVSVLTRAGLQQIAEGTKLLVELGPGPKGRQIKNIVSVLGQAPAPAQDHSRTGPAGPTEKLLGTVKWFRPEKGFGFIAPDDEGNDIFVHKTVIGRLGLESLEDGQRVSMEVHSASKGREALSINLIDGSTPIETPTPKPVEQPAPEPLQQLVLNQTEPSTSDSFLEPTEQTEQPALEPFPQPSEQTEQPVLETVKEATEETEQPVIKPTEETPAEA